MNNSGRMLLLAVCAGGLPAQRPWQRIAVPSISEAAANFHTPPREYGAIHWAIWGNELTRARIVQEFDQLIANGVCGQLRPRSQHVSEVPLARTPRSY